MKTLTITSPDDRITTYENFEGLSEVSFGGYVFIKIVCTGTEIYLNPSRVRDMAVTGV